jgi:hypothetical protein
MRVILYLKLHANLKRSVKFGIGLNAMFFTAVVNFVPH